MRYPNDVQAAILFDRRIGSLEAMVRDFMRIEQGRGGAGYNVPEAKPGVFYRLFGAGELMVTFEYLDHPADPAVFHGSLSSAVTGLLCPDIREQLMRNRSHVLVNISHGVLGGAASEPKIAAMLQQMGVKPEGGSLPQFRRRLDALALAARIACDLETAQAVHWTQSDQLLPAEHFDVLAAEPAPGHLHVHPFLFGNMKGPGGKPHVGVRTFGARHFIGREILVEPSVLPWAANFDAALALLRVATAEKGYLIPDGDTFGPEDRSFSYRVLHRDAAEGDAPLVELVPLHHREHGFQTADYVPEDRVIDDRAPPPELMPADQEEKQELANEWREKRAMAEGIGGRFEVRVRDSEAPPPPASGSPRPTFGRRGVFGRKGAG